MSRFRFDLAGPADDADLRGVLAATPMAGAITVGFQREPSWFEAAVVDGFERQVVACRDDTTGRIIGFGCRSLRELHVNGRTTTVGYLSSLRLLPAYRSLGLVARGYAFFRRLHEDGRTPFYLTTVAEGNDVALRILTSGRVGLPAYHAAGRYHTIAIALPRRGSGGKLPNGIRTACAADAPALLNFLAAHGPRRQFFPVYRPIDFDATGLLRGMDPGRILLAEHAGRIVGTFGLWDQHAYRQQVVHGYSGWLGVARPFINLAAWLRGWPGLPAPGQPLRTLFAAAPVVADDDPAIFRALLTAARTLGAGGPWTHVLVGLHERDPLLATARPFQTACYTSLLFLVCWPDGDAARLALDERVPYLELGSL